MNHIQSPSGGLKHQKWCLAYIYRSICHSVNASLHIEGARCGEKRLCVRVCVCWGGGIQWQRVPTWTPATLCVHEPPCCWAAEAAAAHFYISKTFYIPTAQCSRFCACQTRQTRVSDFHSHTASVSQAMDTGRRVRALLRAWLSRAFMNVWRNSVLSAPWMGLP